MLFLTPPWLHVQLQAEFPPLSREDGNWKFPVPVLLLLICVCIIAQLCPTLGPHGL